MVKYTIESILDTMSRRIQECFDYHVKEENKMIMIDLNKEEQDRMKEQEEMMKRAETTDAKKAIEKTFSANPTGTYVGEPEGTKKTTRLSPPWNEFVTKVQMLFGQDPDIHIKFDDENLVLKLLVDNSVKAEALSKLLPLEKDFGNVTLAISVVPANGFAVNKSELFKDAFAGNPIFANIIEIPDIMLGRPISYVMFKKEVVQYYNDNLGDPHGNTNTLYQDIAKDVFNGNHDGVFFSTTQNG